MHLYVCLSLSHSLYSILSSSMNSFFSSHSAGILLTIHLQYSSFFCNFNICSLGIDMRTSCITSLRTSIFMILICSMNISFTFAVSSSSKHATPNSSPGHSCVGSASSVMSSNLDKLSTRIFLNPEIQLSCPIIYLRV